MKILRKILFVCQHNSGRSQMAEAYFNLHSGGKFETVSAGTLPDESINPLVVEVMKEEGIDLSEQKPKKLTWEMLEGAERVITMGCDVEELCPASLRTEDWRLEDPKGKPLEKVRRIRDEVKSQVLKLIADLNDS